MGFFFLQRTWGHVGTWSNISSKIDFMDVACCRDLFSQHAHYHPIHCNRLTQRVQHAVLRTMLQCVAFEMLRGCVCEVYHGSSQQCCNLCFVHLYGRAFEGRYSGLIKVVE